MARILIVDDSPTQMHVLKKMLLKHKHEIITAVNGEDGIAVAKAEIPDLILMDVVMPKINGFQATRRISKNASTRHIPIILVTTKDQETDMVWGRRQGAKEYLVKPVEETSMMQVVNKLLEA